MGTNAGIAVKEFGFTLLSNPAEPQADVFFIHGLQGHPRGTWTYPPNVSRTDQSQSRRRGFRERLSQALRSRPEQVDRVSKHQVFWPQDLLCESYSNLRIFTYGYDSHVTHWFKGPAMQLDILSHGESLISGLAARRAEDAGRPLLFVVHSLGGLVLKDVLRRARGSTDPRFKAIYSATKGVIFFGTPHRGGNYINIGLTAQKIVACSGLDASDKVLRDLKFDSSIAKMLSEEFTQFLDERRPIVYTFQEASGISGFGPLSGKVVDDISSSLEYSLQFKDHIYANHMDMCRFSGPEDVGYEKVNAAFAHVLSGGIQATSQARGVYQRVLESLFLPDHEERLNQVEKAHKGTFEWLYQDTVSFVQWLQRGNGIFWISGKPASGKSTLLKFAVSDTRTYESLHRNNSANRWITGDYFFTNRGKQEQRCVEGLLQRILFQLLSQSKELLPFIERIFSEHAQHHGWLLIYLEDALKLIVQQRKVPINICLFIDALDEQSEGYYENHATLLNYLRLLTERADGRVVRLLLCLTSRPETIFVDCLRGYPGFRIHEHTQTDIHMFVNNRLTEYLHSRPDLVANSNNTTYFQTLCERICRRAEGVFLWVKLIVVDIIEGLRDGDAPSSLQKKLDTLPGDGDLHQLYTGILLRLTPNYLHEAFLMLWVAYAANEPMPLVEFFQAKGLMTLGETNYDWTTPPVPQMELQLLSRCRGFLEIQYSFSRDEQGREYSGPVVQFLHQSVKDFLRDYDSFDKIRQRLKVRFPTSKALDENGHAYLLRFRVSQHFRRYGHVPHKITALKSFDLRKFDVLYHAYMAEMTLERPIYEPLDALAQFADSYNLTPCYLRHKGWNCPDSWQPTFLVLCVQAGLCRYVQYALGNGGSLHCFSGRPLLHYAVFPMPESLGQARTDPFLATSKMIRLLVDNGAGVGQEFESLTALGFAFKAFYDRRACLGGSQHLIIETLLRAGGSPEIRLEEQLPAQGRDTATIRAVSPLQVAVHKDDQGTVELLLKYGAEINSLDEKDWVNLRKGYLYGDVCPFTNSYKQEEWLRERERAIIEGRNKKPMLRLIERHMNRPSWNMSQRKQPNKSIALPPMVPQLTVEPVFGTQIPDHMQKWRPAPVVHEIDTHASYGSVRRLNPSPNPYAPVRSLPKLYYNTSVPLVTAGPQDPNWTTPSPPPAGSHNYGQAYRTDIPQYRPPPLHPQIVPRNLPDRSALNIDRRHQRNTGVSTSINITCRYGSLRPLQTLRILFDDNFASVYKVKRELRDDIAPDAISPEKWPKADGRAVLGGQGFT
ncbi:uncharacterized protein K460DRAFT_411532 [Cucurbitaria berberidis CBS 394.84]|uniref:NACHT domain-containing protein n=1 Tax=Cucurbitaria berberidis CBS 394.84 TaxID=1168544 RepID=A0A9P4GRC8_9PLEO|nr:uncharacterized protein K460DRAFT_411532 [Cucurbitaria berberidis CBS 394.84]KAF1849701.1 hypothetical protein K460DRAFT_411532 [Cucurbitaria berberidis CBS 394.84]